VYRLFRREHPRYRSPETVPDSALRNMIANWHPSAERTRNGFYKNLGIQPFVDAFTGEAVGRRGGSVVGETAAAAAGGGGESSGGGAADAAAAE
jgi:hypothetical protein